MADEVGTITELLIAWNDGEEKALDELMSLVYDYLRGMAANHLRRERPDHTLDPAALVSEAFLRLVRQNQVRWQDRTHFFAIAARAMRRILVDHARFHRGAKRTGETVRLSPEAFDQLPTERPGDLILLDEALRGLEEYDPLLAKIVEMRYFVGLTKEEIAKALGIAPATVGRRFRLARAWLFRVLVQGEEGDPE